MEIFGWDGKMSIEWASSDLADMCARDTQRVAAFAAAIARSVVSGARVLDVGAGTGVLSLLAATRGASVTAVEADPRLAWDLQRTAALYPSLSIDCVHADIFDVSFAGEFDVVICELVDTGLLEEQFVPVVSHLRDAGAIGPETWLLPSGYTTRISLHEIDREMAGFELLSPRHQWPFYQHEPWQLASSIELTTPTPIFGWTHPQRINSRQIRESVSLIGKSTGTANCVAISGIMALDDVALEEFNSLNSTKLLFLDRPVSVRFSESVELEVACEMGSGLKSFSIGGHLEAVPHNFR